ncbi:MAG: alpha-L-fucosidase, partial [Mangrovibacterium sp.]|nr:alpha-L-fucosidase [Mangrovibacterium sp.]
HAEWIRHTAQIPLEQYNQFVSQFDPEKFNADEWVALAKNAGMKYIVITSKHHDGFCLFDSKETDFDIMATPFKRDILKELSSACAKQGIKLCFYYSIMDWHHPDYLPRRDWEKHRPADNAAMNRYVAYMKNQLKELLTNYGKIGVLWFDGEWENTWTHECGKELYDYLKDLQPDLIINNRVDKGRTDETGLLKDSIFYGDFGTPEQKIPPTGLPGTDWESCMTMNDHWGYNKYDQNWKSTSDLIRNLVDIVSKGGNFLLNAGPTAEGLFPEASITRLKEIGEWMNVNGESVHGANAGPFAKELIWGKCTQKSKGNKTTLYLHIFNWPDDGQLIIPGLENKILKTHALYDKSAVLQAEKKEKAIIIDVQNVKQSEYATVIAMEIKGEPAIED